MALMVFKGKWSDKRIYLYPIFFIILISLLSEVFIFFGLSLLIIYVVFFPLVEELAKLLLARINRYFAYKLIVVFCVYELLLVKVPILFKVSNELNLYLLLLSASPMVFHFLTALVYRFVEYKNHQIACFIFLLITHIILNYLPELHLAESKNYATRTLLVFSPLIWIAMFRYRDLKFG